MSWNKSAFGAQRNGPAISRQFSGGLYSRSSSGNLQLPQGKQRGRWCSIHSVFAFVTGIILTIMFLRSPAFHHGFDGASAAPSMHTPSRSSPRAQILTSLLGSQSRELASSTTQQEGSRGMNFHTLIHRKELSKQEQDPHPRARAGNKGALSSSSSGDSKKLHVLEENIQPEIEADQAEATDQQTQASSHKTAEEPVGKAEGKEDSEEAEDELAAMNREETEAAAIQGLRDALESTDKEASVDIKLERESNKKPGKEQQNSEGGEDEDEEPLPEALSGASQTQDSAILDDFINGASLQVTERNGMIVPEELEVHKETEKSRGQQESMEAATQPQDSTVTVEDAAEVTEKEPNTASEIKTEVTTEDMSVEQNADDNNGKSEGWSAELEQPKISTAVETEADPGKVTEEVAP